MLKTDCHFTLQQLLFARFNTLVASGTNLSAAQTFHNLALTANNLDEGFWNQLRGFYDPLTPAFLLKTQALNDSIASGDAVPTNFHEYVKMLAASLAA
jgi:hypothetical protein